MLRHVALFRWKPQATAADGVQEGNADFALVADFIDAEGLKTYSNHPDHVEAVKNLIRPIVAKREAIQYVIEHTD